MRNKKFISAFIAFTIFITSTANCFAYTIDESTNTTAESSNANDESTNVGDESTSANDNSTNVDDDSTNADGESTNADGESTNADGESTNVDDENTNADDESTDEIDGFINPFSFEEPNLERLQGSTDYETAALIADKQNYNSAILVNLDNNIADGLSASGLAGATKSPILLTKKDTIPDVTMQRLSTKVNKVYIIGGINSISSSVENKLKSKGINVIRIQGEDRFDTSIKVAKEIEKYSNPKYVFLVNGHKGDVDAISISPVSCIYKSPIILTDGNKTNYSTSGKECYVIGGTNNMSDNIVNNNNATRISGEDRFKTNEEVINHFLDTEVYCNLIADENLNFYIADGYKLPSGLLASTISNDCLFSLVSKESEKGYLFVANKIVACGTLDESIIKESLNPYPVYKDMFGMWISDSNDKKELSVDPEFLMTFINGEPEDTSYQNAKWKIRKFDRTEKSVIIEELGASSKKYTKLTQLSDTRLKLEKSSDMSNWVDKENFTSVFAQEGQNLMLKSSGERAAYKQKRIVRLCRTSTLGHLFNLGIAGITGNYSGPAVQRYIKKKGKQAAKRVFTRTVASRLIAKGARPLARNLTLAVDVALEFSDVGSNIARIIEKGDPKPGNGWIEISR